MKNIRLKQQVLICLIFSLSAIGISNGQQKVLDSLSRVWKDQTYSKQKNTLKTLIQEYAYINTDSSYLYINTLQEIIKNEDKEGKILLLLLQGNLLYDRALYDSSLSLSNKALALAIELKDTNRLSRIYLNLGSTYDAIGKKDVAIENYFESINMFSTLSDSVNVAYLKINIGLLFKSLNDFEKAEKYYLESLSELTALNDEFGIATVNTNLSSLFEELGYHDEAIKYSLKGKGGYEQLGYEAYAIYPLGTLANSYLALELYEKSLEYFDQAIEIAVKNSFNEELFNLRIGRAKALVATKRVSEAQLEINMASKLVKSSNSIEDFRDFYEAEFLINKASEKWKKAAVSLERHQKFKDSIFVRDRFKALDELETKYQTAQKEQQLTEKELEVQTKEATIANQQNVIILVSSGMGFILLIGLIIYNRNQAIQKQKLSEAVLAEKEKGYSSIITATEQERNRISKDLHDGIGQELSALKLAIKAVSEKETDVKQKKELEEIANTFSKSADEVRNISHQMMPRALMENGLMPAIDDLLKNVFKHSQTSYTLEESGISERFEERIEVSVYRIIQELINNIIKHAEATQVSVQLIAKNNQLLVFVEDNGKGFNEKSKNEGHGLVNIKSRVEMINGSVNFEPSSSKGTFVSLAIPIDNHA